MSVALRVFYLMNHVCVSMCDGIQRQRHKPQSKISWLASRKNTRGSRRYVSPVKWTVPKCRKYHTRRGWGFVTVRKCDRPQLWMGQVTAHRPSYPASQSPTQRTHPVTHPATCLPKKTWVALSPWNNLIQASRLTHVPQRPSTVLGCIMFTVAMKV